MKSLIRPLVLAMALVGAVTAHAQEVVTSGLLTPSKLIFTPRGHLLVAEAGNGANSGRVSIVNRISGTRRTLLGGLPSGFSSAEEDPSPSGPSGLVVNDNTLYVLIGEVDTVLPGPVAGSQRPNPSPLSAMRSAILSFEFARNLDDIATPIVLSAADRGALNERQTITIGTGSDAATAKLIADLPDYRIEPRPDYLDNVRASNPYGLAMIGDSFYIADAGWNSVRRVSRATGAVTTVTEFPQVPNPTPVGPPLVDPVPDSIRADGERLLVTLLTGFPFAPGVSSVVAVNPNTGGKTILVSGVTTAIDVVPVGIGDTGAYVVSQFSTNLGAGAPGKITLHQAGQPAVTLADPIVSPSSIAVDGHTGEIFATQIFTGELTKITAPEQLPFSTPSSIIPIVGSVPGVGNSRFETSLQMTNVQAFPVSGNLVLHTSGGVVTVPYELAANATRSYHNLLGSAGVSGTATLDINAAVGPAPRAIARIYDTSYTSAATGGMIDQVSPEEALLAGDRGILVAASDPATSRTNIGFRSLGASTLRVTLHRANGAAVSTKPFALAANELMQMNLAAMFEEAAAADDSIVVQVLTGAVIPYASVVNNTTHETSWHRAVRIE